MTLLQFITYAGTFVFALTGAFKARAFKMDVLVVLSLLLLQPMAGAL